MSGRLGISTIVYSKAFVSRTWSKRADMLDYEKKGFFQFLYVTACGYVESVICDYLHQILFFPLHEMQTKKLFPKRPITVNGQPAAVDTEPEQRAVQRLLERTVDEIGKAPLERLESLHQTIVGLTIRDFIGAGLHDDLKGLVSVRNVLAHGRMLYVDLDESFRADVRFEQHPLENAIKSLRQRGIFSSDHVSTLEPNEVMAFIYRDDTMVHFWNAAVDIAVLYFRAADEAKFVFGRAEKLEKLQA